MNGSTEQELSRSEAQVSAQDGRLEDGSDMGREEVAEVKMLAQTRVTKDAIICRWKG